MHMLSDSTAIGSISFKRRSRATGFCRGGGVRNFLLAQAAAAAAAAAAPTAPPWKTEAARF